MTQLLTPEQVADRLNVKKRTVYEMLARGGALHHLRIELGGKLLRVDPAKLEEHIAKGAK